MSITSPQNPLLAEIRRAVDSGRPLGDGSIAAEGPHLLSEALNSPWRVQHVFCSVEMVEKHRSLLDAAVLGGHQRIEVTEVGTRAFKSMSDTEQTQGIVSLIQPRRYAWQDMTRSDAPLVILDGIQDPGNAGAIVRSAEAFGCSGVILTEGCVRISNGKLMRASAGSIFRLPFLENYQRKRLISEIQLLDRTMFALSPDAEHSVFDTKLDYGFALVVGSEGKGLSPELRNAGQGLCIPTESVESLNAAVACSVTLFEAARQRTKRRA